MGAQFGQTQPFNVERLDFLLIRRHETVIVGLDDAAHQFCDFRINGGDLRLCAFSVVRGFVVLRIPQILQD